MKPIQISKEDYTSIIKGLDLARSLAERDYSILTQDSELESTLKSLAEDFKNRNPQIKIIPIPEKAQIEISRGLKYGTYAAMDRDNLCETVIARDKKIEEFEKYKKNVNTLLVFTALALFIFAVILM